MRYIIVKEGEHRPNAFSDLAELVNTNDDHEQVGLYTRMDYALKLVRNRSRLDPHLPLALVHYYVDPAAGMQQRPFFRPVDVESMVAALDHYDYVLFGVISTDRVLDDYKLVNEARYYARNQAGKLIDIETNAPVIEDGQRSTNMIAYFGMVRMDGLPGYQIILDPKLVHASGCVDFEDETTCYKLVTDYDGYVRDNVFNPIVTGGMTYGDNLIFATSDTITIEFFKGLSIMRREDNAKLLRQSFLTINSSLPVTQENGKLIVKLTPGNHYLNVVFDCGHFYRTANKAERPEFAYLILSNDNQRN